MGDKYGLDKEIADKLNKKYDEAMEADAIKWIEEITGDALSSKDVPAEAASKAGMKLHYLLKDGSSLCKLANSLQPGLIKKFAGTPGHQLEERNNIQQYLVACARLMIPDADLFSISDLHEAKDMTQVLQNIYAVGRQAQVLEGFEGPRLGVKFTTSLQVQKERKQRRKMEEIFAQEKQIEKEEEALHRRRKLETRQMSISETKYNDEEKRATRRRLRRGDTVKEDTHSLRHRRFEVEDVSFGLDAETKEALEAKYDYIAEQHVLDWIELLTGETLDYFYEGLRSGVVLCKLLNVIRPGMIKDISTKPVALMERENLKRYLRAVQALGLQSFELFIVSDLYDKKNLSAVLTNLRALGRKAETMSSFPGPYLKDVEQGRVSVNSINIADTEIEDRDKVGETFLKKKVGGAKALQDLFAAPSSSEDSSLETSSESKPSMDAGESKDDEIEKLQALLDASKSGKRAKMADMKKMMEDMESDRKKKQEAMDAEEEEIRREEEKLIAMQRDSARRRAAFATRSKSVAVEPKTEDLAEEAARQIRLEMEAEKLRREKAIPSSSSSSPLLATSSTHYIKDTASANNSDDESGFGSEDEKPEEGRGRSHSVSDASYQPPKLSLMEKAALEEQDRQERLDRRRRHRLAMEAQEQAEEAARALREADRKAKREKREAEERAAAAESDAAAERRRVKREESLRQDTEDAHAREAKERADAEEKLHVEEEARVAAEQKAEEARKAAEAEKLAVAQQLAAEQAAREAMETETRAKAAQDAKDAEERVRAAAEQAQREEAARKAAEQAQRELDESARQAREAQDLAAAAAAQEAEEKRRQAEAEDAARRRAQEAEVAETRRIAQQQEAEAAARREAELARQADLARIAAEEEAKRLEAEAKREEEEMLAREAEEDRLRAVEEQRKKEAREVEERERQERLETIRLKRAAELKRLQEEEEAIAAEEAKFAAEQVRQQEEFARVQAENRARREEERKAKEKAEAERKRLLEAEHAESERRQELERKAQREAEEQLMALAAKRAEEARAAAATKPARPPTTPKKTGANAGVNYQSPKLAAGSPKGSPRTPRDGTGRDVADPVPLDLDAPLGPDPLIDRTENTSLLVPPSNPKRGCPCTIL